MSNDIRIRVRTMLLAELKAGKRSWYYVSVADEERFICGYYLQAFGDTDAFLLSHALKLYPPGCGGSTLCIEATDEDMKPIPEKDRWRRLTLEEVQSHGPVIKTKSVEDN